MPGQVRARSGLDRLRPWRSSGPNRKLPVRDQPGTAHASVKMDDQLLIESVKENSELYDLTHPRYCDIAHKTKLWKEIGRKLHYDAKKCKQRWESLRSQFRKHVRNQKTKYRDSGGMHTKWRYGENLQFLIPYMKERTRASVDGSDDNEEEAEVSQESNEPMPQVKLESEPLVGESSSIKQEPEVRKTLQYHEMGKVKLSKQSASCVAIKNVSSKKRRKVEEPDEYDLFLDAMKKTIKKFSAADKLLVKRQIFDIVAEVEEKYVDGRQPGLEPQYHEMYPYLARTQFGHHVFDPSASPPYQDTSESQPSSPASARSAGDLIQNA